jgi:hypothetical protein
MSLDRRSFIASSVVGLDVFRRKIASFDFDQPADTPKEKSITDIPDIPLTAHHRIDADGVHVFYLELVPRTLWSSSCSMGSRRHRFSIENRYRASPTAIV